MLPATLVTIITFLLEMCTASPVYNMQPAFITANIGTTGRNIRNLPCISRKNNQRGVCMFAIDCLKTNGTHLGTCIDRFYFGSCCHIDHEILDNSIIPSREPPYKLSSTTKLTTPTTEFTTSTSVTSITSTTTTRRPITTTERTTIQTTKKKLTTTTKSTPRPIEETTIGYKLTTFQSVDGSFPIETTTAKVVQPTTLKVTKPTSPKPKPTSTKPAITKPNGTGKPITKPPTRPKPTKAQTKPSPKPIKTTTKPSRITTNKPVSVTATRKPVVITKPTKKITTTTQSTTRTTTKSTTVAPDTEAPKPVKPETTTSLKPETTTSVKPETTSSMKPETTISIKPETTSSPKPMTASVVVEISTKPVVDIKKNFTAVLQPVDGNPATNEIETASSSSATLTTQAAIVTWATVDGDKNESAITGTTANSTSEEWVPVTPPDGWVLLPNLGSNTTTSVTEISSAIPSSTSTENTSKPSITYIPFESTSVPTTPALNTSTVTTEGASTPSTPSTPVATTSPTMTSSPDEVRPVNMSDFTDVCGRRMFPEARIVGGEKSSFGKWPWQISLRQWRTSTYLHKCGAALLNENWAITAAHCVDNVPPSDLLLRLGEHDLSTETEPYLHQERRVQIVASHPQFDPRTFEYDLALLRFYEPVTFQPNILPVCVPQADESFVGRTAYVTGWGRLYEDGPLPSVLQEVSVPVINNSVCESMYRSAGYIEHIPHIFICAGWRRGGFDSCEGDSGGPMVIQREDKRFLLAGVISWGIGCAEPNQPGVYTRISEFKDWINQILQF